MSFYLFWTAIAVLGALLAAAERKWIARPVFGALLALGVVCGLATMQLSPFNFATGGYYMEGVLLSAASALALAGYVLVIFGVWIRRVTR